MHSIMIFGDSGFVGKHICSEFALRGIPHMVADSRKSEEWQRKIGSIEEIIWAAGGFNPISAESNPILVEKCEDDWTQFLGHLVQGEFKGRLIFLSSGGCVYDGEKEIYSEMDSTLGINAYGKSKIKMENSLRESGLKYLILRVANLYGPNQPVGRGQGVIAEWVDRLMRDQSIKLFGSGELARDFLYVSDFCEAINKVIAKQDSTGVYNLGSGVATPLKDIIQILNKHLKNDTKIEVSAYRKIDRHSYCLDIKRFTKEFKWSPRINIDEGISLILKSHTNGE